MTPLSINQEDYLKKAMDSEKLTQDIYAAMQVPYLSERHDAIKKLFTTFMTALLDEAIGEQRRMYYPNHVAVDGAVPVSVLEQLKERLK